MTGEQHLGEPDPAAVARDDALLDRLASAVPEPGDDPAAALLAAWRARAAETVPESVRPEVVRLAAGPELAVRRRLGASVRIRRQVAVSILCGAVVLVAGTGLLASNADPDSPLWTVSRLLDSRGADARQAEYAIVQARLAAADGRYADARAQLDRAALLIERLGATDRARDLQRQSDDVRRLIPPVASPEPGATESVAPVGGVPGSAAASSARPEPGKQLTPAAGAGAGTPHSGGAKADGEPGRSGSGRPSPPPTPRARARAHHA